jgi:hypothetical protein
MQIVLRCKYCSKITVSDSDSDVCLEIDALEEELKFVCRFCKKENKLKLTNNKKNDPLPRIGVSKY